MGATSVTGIGSGGYKGSEHMTLGIHHLIAPRPLSAQWKYAIIGLIASQIITFMGLVLALMK